MRSNKQTIERTNRVPKDESMTEMYERIKLSGGYARGTSRISPREFGKQLASNLIEKIDKEVIIKDNKKRA